MNFYVLLHSLGIALFGASAGMTFQAERYEEMIVQILLVLINILVISINTKNI